MRFIKIGEFVDFAFAAVFAASMVVFLMLTGCFDTTAGGTAEETSVEMAYNVPIDTSSKPADTSLTAPDTSSKTPVDSAEDVLYKNVNLKGYARCVAQLPNSKPEQPLDPVLGADTVFKLVASELVGHTVRLSELDSVTLLPTG